MGRKIEVEINGVVYRGVTASAKDQVEMLQVAAKCGALPILHEGTTDMGLAAALASADNQSFSRLKALCISGGDIVRSTDNVPVAENLFQDEAHNYLVLVGRVLKENIGVFWQLSEGSENGAEKEQKL